MLKEEMDALTPSSVFLASEETYCRIALHTALDLRQPGGFVWDYGLSQHANLGGCPETFPKVVGCTIRSGSDLIHLYGVHLHHRIGIFQTSQHTGCPMKSNRGDRVLARKEGRDASALVRLIPLTASSNGSRPVIFWIAVKTTDGNENWKEADQQTLAGSVADVYAGSILRWTGCLYMTQGRVTRGIAVGKWRLGIDGVVYSRL